MQWKGIEPFGEMVVHTQLCETIGFGGRSLNRMGYIHIFIYYTTSDRPRAAESLYAIWPPYRTPAKVCSSNQEPVADRSRVT